MAKLVNCSLIHAPISTWGLHSPFFSSPSFYAHMYFSRRCAAAAGVVPQPALSPVVSARSTVSSPVFVLYVEVKHAEVKGLELLVSS